MKHTYPDGETYAIPREPSAYRPTDHFMQMKRVREDPPVTGEVINNCFTEGDLADTNVSDRYKFVWKEQKPRSNDHWYLIVAVDRAAFERESRKHHALTIYVEGAHDYDRFREKYDI